MKLLPDRPIHHPRRQRGASLLVSLVFLLILSLLGVAAMTGTTMEERMARNSRDSGIALNAAEAGMRDAEIDLTMPGSRVVGAQGFTCDCQNGLCLPSSHPVCAAANGGVVGSPVWDSGAFASDSTVAPSMGTYTAGQAGAVTIGRSLQGGGTLVNGGVARAPRYVMEVFNDPMCSHRIGVPCTNHYRITAEGTGPNANTTMMVQEDYRPYQAGGPVNAPPN